MIDVRQGGPGEVEVELLWERGQITWDDDSDEHIHLCLDTSKALDLANKLMDIVQAMDDAKREKEP